MDTVGQQILWTYCGNEKEAKEADNTSIRLGPGHHVASYLELAKKIAELQFKNRDFVLLFRGQAGDYFNRYGSSSLKPSLFRPLNCKPNSRDPKTNKPPNELIISERFEKLSRADQLLLQNYRWHSMHPSKSPKSLNHRSIERLDLVRLKRQRILRWALLQHYDICSTPLLDVTSSLRVAASFASVEGVDLGYIFVIGVPNLSGAVTASAEAGLQIVRLSSVCPPVAVRPHLQEGYLLGEYPELGDFRQKESYSHHEIDFGRRLLAKFRFEPHLFWRDDAFSKIDRHFLFPSGEQDPVFKLSLIIKNQLV